VPSVAVSYATKGRLAAAADAGHMKSKSEESYGTFYEIVVYDANNSLCSIVAMHDIDNESSETWSDACKAAASVSGFDRQGRTLMVDMEKGCGSAISSAFRYTERFLDERHVVKNSSPHLGNERATGLLLYKRALRAPSKARVDDLVQQYGPRQKDYMDKYKLSELYKAYSGLEDLVVTSQGAESSMNAALKNNIRNVEPMAALQNIVMSQFNKFNRVKKEAMSCLSMVPPRIEALLAGLVLKAQAYPSVVPVAGTDFMRWAVRSLSNPAIVRQVVMPTEPQTVPKCCDYSKDGTGFPCLHGVAAIIQKHGVVNVYKFIDKKHLTAAWQDVYRGVEYNLPPQDEVDTVLREAKKKVLAGTAVQIPKALPPPRGRPPANAGIRKADWPEKGAAHGKKRAYTCGLCGRAGHTRDKCSLQQGKSSSSSAGGGGVGP
jgi:hypothetical protein